MTDDLRRDDSRNQRDDERFRAEVLVDILQSGLPHVVDLLLFHANEVPCEQHREHRQRNILTAEVRKDSALRIFDDRAHRLDDLVAEERAVLVRIHDAAIEIDSRLHELRAADFSFENPMRIDLFARLRREIKCEIPFFVLHTNLRFSEKRHDRKPSPCLFRTSLFS